MEKLENFALKSKIIKASLAALPTCENNKTSILRFLHLLDNERKLFEPYFDEEFEKMWINRLFSKLTSDLFFFVKENQLTYGHFTKGLLRKSKVIRKTSELERQAIILKQEENETLLEHIEKLELLMMEYKLALQEDNSNSTEKVEKIRKKEMKKNIMEYLRFNLKPEFSHFGLMKSFEDVKKVAIEIDLHHRL
jgi:hypothetical protein